MSIHTPGPWEVAHHPGDSSGTDWRTIIAPSPFGPQYISQAMMTNARLIAAAPDLLAALTACLEYIPGSEVRSWPPGFALKAKAMELSAAAIAKVNAPPVTVQ